MVWEQRCAAIVVLGRLQETNESAWARYWPEEGSEVYHTYEVNLVSEHICCDEYLVRSFYLKNLRNNESRTVTQFHYLAWPQNGKKSPQFRYLSTVWTPHMERGLFTRQVWETKRLTDCSFVNSTEQEQHRPSPYWSSVAR